MQKWLLCFIIFFGSLHVRAQLTIIVDVYPEGTSEVFVAGLFSNWKPADDGFKMEQQGNRYVLLLNPGNDNKAEFKFTSGSWESGEVQADGTAMENRLHYFDAGDTIFCSIAGWQDQFVAKAKPINTKIIYAELFAVFLDTTKTLRIYLPPDYDSTQKHYPVVYMLDGQNLFDAATAYNGEWEADETMDAFYAAGKPTAIIVGIDHAGTKRLEEYAPWTNAEYGGGLGDAFAAWLTDSVKTFIDEQYRTKIDRENTYIIGSSIAATTSLYALLEHNDIFGGAGVVSPAFWFNPELFDYVPAHAPQLPSEVYFICGGNEDEGVVFDMMVVYDLMNEPKNAAHTYRFVVESAGRHNEAFWRKELPGLLDWLLAE